MGIANVHALAFDTYGTVVDWRGTLIEEGQRLNQERGLEVDWAAFVDEWKRCYRPGMDAVNAGQRPWTRVQVLYRERLDELVPRFGLEALSEADLDWLNRVWSRSRPWPDAVSALERLKRRYAISTLSNGDFLWLVQMAKRSALPWDCVLTAENVRRYKPAPEVYRMAIELLGPRPEQVMLVACHNYDLRAARSHGMCTAFLPRVNEFGPAQTADRVAEEDWDVVAEDLSDLAARLGC